MEKIIKETTEKLNNGTITKDEADKILKPNQHLRVTLDIDISFEEASFIKEKAQ